MRIISLYAAIKSLRKNLIHHRHSNYFKSKSLYFFSLKDLLIMASRKFFFSHMPLHLIKIHPSSLTIFINCQTYTFVCIPNTHQPKVKIIFREWTTNDKTTICSTYYIHIWLFYRHQVYIQYKILRITTLKNIYSP